MTSEERHEIRYQRRKTQRALKKQQNNKTFNEVMSFQNLCAAGLKCCNGTRWKTSTINFETYLLRDSYRNYQKLQNNNYKTHPFVSFYTFEHGKLRDIDAMTIQDREVQKCLSNNFLTPVYSKSFVYDNGACLQNKGMDFQLNRIKKHLHDHYHKYGTEGGIYQFDFSSYFKSLPHDEIKKRNELKTSDSQIINLFNNLIDDFNNIGVIQEKEKGVGLGGEVSQLIALEYANPLDHFIKEQLHIHGFGRYNDDNYIISSSIEELKEIQKQVSIFIKKLGLNIHPKKNKITSFKHHSFKFLKIRFTLTDSGKIIMKPNNKIIQNMRHKIKAFKKWLNIDKMTLEDICQSYQACRAHLKRCTCWKILHSLDLYFINTFKTELMNYGKYFLCTVKAYQNNGKWIYNLAA